MENLLTIALITVVPWIELRGAIPIGIGLGLDPWSVLITAVIVNIFIFFPIFFGLKFLYRFLSKWDFFEKIISRVRRRGEPYVRKYGIIGLSIFIGIPLPFSGIYSGTLLAWVIGMKWKRAFLGAIIGVLLAGTIIFAASMGLFSAIGLVL